MERYVLTDNQFLLDGIKKAHLARAFSYDMVNARGFLFIDLNFNLNKHTYLINEKHILIILNPRSPYDFSWVMIKEMHFCICNNAGLGFFLNQDEHTCDSDLLNVATHYELKVFELLMCGMSNANIARRLLCSEKHVSYTKVRLMRKLNVNNVSCLLKTFKIFSSLGLM